MDPQHDHCLSCYDQNCTSHQACAVISCPNECGAKLHSCKKEDHILLCSRTIEACINKPYGCPFRFERGTQSSHLHHCPASTVFCSHVWFRRCSGLQSETAQVASDPPLASKHLDFAMALRDQWQVGGIERLMELSTASVPVQSVFQGTSLTPCHTLPNKLENPIFAPISVQRRSIISTGSTAFNTITSDGALTESPESSPSAKLPSELITPIPAAASFHGTRDDASSVEPLQRTGQSGRRQSFRLAGVLRSKSFRLKSQQTNKTDEAPAAGSGGRRPSFLRSALSGKHISESMQGGNSLSPKLRRRLRKSSSSGPEDLDSEPPTHTPKALSSYGNNEPLKPVQKFHFKNLAKAVSAAVTIAKHRPTQTRPVQAEDERHIQRTRSFRNRNRSCTPSVTEEPEVLCAGPVRETSRGIAKRSVGSSKLTLHKSSAESARRKARVGHPRLVERRLRSVMDNHAPSDLPAARAKLIHSQSPAQTRLRLGLSLCSAPPLAYRGNGLVQLRCSKVFRRDEIARHQEFVHAGVDSLVSAQGLQQRCPLAMYGCQYVRQSLRMPQRGWQLRINMGCLCSQPATLTGPYELDEGATPDTHLTCLPIDVLCLICSFLDPLSLACLAGTCSHLRQLAANLIQDRGLVNPVWIRSQSDGELKWTEAEMVSLFFSSRFDVSSSASVH